MNYDKINQRIQTLESELAGLESGLAELKAELSKANNFKFDYINMKTSFIGTYCVSNNASGSDPLDLETFRYRHLKSNADADLQLQKELMCIGALAEQIDPDYRSEVRFDGDEKYAVIKKDSTYQISSHHSIRYPGVVYMPIDVAEKVCEILNNKQVKI